MNKSFQVDLPLSESSTKNIFKEKLGELTFLSIDKIQISEFNTRCQIIDEFHIKTLMKSIEKHGYIPKSAVWINAVTGPASKEVISYRLIAGRHRYEAARRLGLKEIPCQLYYNLSDEEECEMDNLDNELDEHHKPINFLAIAEHYKYLRDVKGWSQRQIAKVKNVSKGIVYYRWKIADLPEEVKVIIRGAHPGGQLHEKYFRDICKLSSIQHQITVCNEILSKSNDNEKSYGCNFEANIEGQPECTSQYRPVSQSEVKEMVDRFLVLEKRGFVTEQNCMDDVPVEKIIADNESYGRNLDDKNLIYDVYPDDSKGEVTNVRKKIKMDMPAIVSEHREENGVKFAITPLWLQHTDLIDTLGIRSYYILSKLVSYDFRYKPDKDGLFFIKYGQKYKNCFDFLGHLVGVKAETVEKKLLPSLSDYVFYKKTGDILKFHINWDKLYKKYEEVAAEVSIDDGGLAGIPGDYKGCLRPTPYHSIYIEKGIPVRYEKTVQEIVHGSEWNSDNKPLKVERTGSRVDKKEKILHEHESKSNIKAFKSDDKILQQEDVNSLLGQELKRIGIAEKKIPFFLSRKNDTENIIKYLNEMTPDQKSKIKNIPGYIYKVLKDGFKPPEGFVSVEVAEEKKERKKAVEDFVDKIEESFRNGEIKYFITGDGSKYPISFITPDKTTLVYKKNNGIPGYVLIREHMEERFFQ